MKRSTLFTALLFCLGGGAQASNAAGVNCAGSQSLLAERHLPPLVTRAFYNRAGEELDVSGRVVLPGQRLPELADDSYLFIVVNLTGKSGEETVVYGLRAPTKNSESERPTGPGFVATHQSLVRQLARELDVGEEKIYQSMYASGEFQTLSGNLHQVSNASPFFRSGKEQLDYSVSVLDGKMAKTLPGPPKAVLAPKKGVTFDTEKAMAQAAIANRIDPGRSSMREDLIMLIGQLAKKIPSEDTRAGLDVDRLVALRNHYLESFPKAERPANDFEPLIPLVLGARSKGIDVAIDEFCKSVSGACLQEFDGYFKNFIGAIGVYGLRVHKFTD